LFKHSYTFIIGAGASKPYNYPTGPELYNQIRKFYTHHVKDACNSSPRSTDEISQIRKAKDFVQELGLTSHVSIDKYININSGFNEQGVLAIATQIYACECQSKLPPIHNPEGDWYSWLYEKMTDGINSPGELMKFIENRISFITFNYDRSLEHYLFENLYGLFKNTNVSRKQVAEVLNHLEFIHIYGQIGKLPWQKGVFSEDPSTVDFGINGIVKYGDSNFKPYLVAQKALKNIDVMYSSRRDNEILIKARDIIKSAERIVFLGFGYDKQNLEILDLPKLLNGKQVYGTALDKTKHEIEEIRASLMQNNIHITPDIHPVDCLNLLRNYL
jgi:hypothetical protein